ncbi:MAG: hypothetical protein HYY16_01125 [Planctomycetes bacterium]|nr:hypothetical protein [Planctomycetota bacterium]
MGRSKPEKKGEAPKPPGDGNAPSPPKPPKPPSRINRWITLLLVLMLLFVSYSVARDVLYRRVLYGLAQRSLNLFATGAVDKMGAVELTAEGNIVIRDAVMAHHHRGRTRTFYRADRVEIALDGWPLRDDPVYVSRVDLFHPEMWIVRETDGDWNIVWAFQPAPTEVETPVVQTSPAPVAPTPAPVEHPSRGGWPRNGVHVHQGIIHITFLCQDGRESNWDITNVNGVIARASPGIRFHPLKGDFYGGALTGEAHITSYRPFRMDLQLTLRNADAGRLAAGRSLFQRPIRGRVDGVLALKSDLETIGWRPVCAGRIEVNDGDLWDLPPFMGVLATLALTEVGDRKLTAAHIEFTVERDKVRIDQMDFLGTPLCLFGDGTMELTGENLDVTMVPRLGKSWDDILPFVGLPIQWLLDVAKGALVSIRITGAFWAPVFMVGDTPVNEPVRRLIEEKGPK